MPIAEQTAILQKLLSSSPDTWLTVGAMLIDHPNVGSWALTDYPGGFTADDHEGNGQDWAYAPVSMDVPSLTGDMDAEFSFTVGDLNEDGQSVGNSESILSIIQGIGDSDVLPTLTLLSYIAYEDGTFSNVVDGPYEYQITNVTFTEQGAKVTAQSPDAVYASCGIRYTVKDFPMLRQYM